MKILILGPKKHGMSVGIEVLHRALLEHPQVSKCRWEGSSDIFSSLAEIEAGCSRILASVNLSEFDVVNMHFGMLEAEQFIPILLRGKAGLPPFVYSVHSLQCDLFDRIERKDLSQLVNQALGNFFEGYVFFGTYAKKVFAQRYGTDGEVIFLPARHLQVGLTLSRRLELESLFGVPPDEPFVALGGYSSPWKDWETLLRAFTAVHSPMTFLFAGPSWDKHLGFTERQIGKVRVRAVSCHIERDKFRFLAERSLFGVFPYTEDPRFQGSGALPNYLAAGKPCIVTSVANLPEMVGDAGICVPAGDAEALAEVINTLLDDNKTRQDLEVKAKNRAYLFLPAEHANQLVHYLESLLKSSRSC